MSYAEHPESNPYAPPLTADVGAQKGPRAVFYGYAGFWRRFAAYLLDGIITGIITFPISLGIAFAGMAVLGRNEQSLNIASGIAQLVNVLILVLYYAVLESSSSQATFGKQALGCKVVDLKGHRISFGRALGRMIAKILSILIFLIGFIMAGFTQKKQALHDMIAGTLVIKTR